ncbi:MAG TPA: 4-(cytidine 5'-diphospho)-2-C-methyl-D-erythritol kinase [Terriglobales bacterium]|nr:4-(cytidine 5'-diphospho)-2-C-methyl-D-erythritol kinase [Terriglobales bacterium]
MTVAVRSFAKINLGLYIGRVRADGFHDLRTVYQTIAWHDLIRVTVGRGRGIEILCKDPRVPLDSSNTCYRIAERVMDEFGRKGIVTVEIEKRLPVQGGLGAASSNAVATMMGLERALKKSLMGATRLRIAAEVGSDLPLFLIGGTVLGVGRGEEVYPLPDLAAGAMVVVTPEVGVSTPQAFGEWDEVMRNAEAAELRSEAGRSARSTRTEQRSVATEDQLTHLGGSDRLVEVGRVLSSWLSGLPNAGAPARGGSRAGSLLLDLVRTGIENDFEKVVFPQHPELRDIKRALERAGARYASLSGSGSTLYGLFRSRAEAVKAAGRLRKRGVTAVATSTLTRRAFERKSLVASRE